MDQGNGELRGLAEGLAQYGRGGDTMLMHVSPIEVAELNRLFPGSITTNPYTGQPEALFWILPALLSAITGGAGGVAGGISTLLTNLLPGALGTTAAAPTTTLASALNTISAATGTQGLAGAASIGSPGSGAVLAVPETIPGAFIAPTAGEAAVTGVTEGGIAGATEATAGEGVAEGGAAVAEAAAPTAAETGISGLIERGASGLGELIGGQVSAPANLATRGLEGLKGIVSGLKGGASGLPQAPAGVPTPSGVPSVATPGVDPAILESVAQGQVAQTPLEQSLAESLSYTDPGFDPISTYGGPRPIPSGGPGPFDALREVSFADTSRMPLTSEALHVDKITGPLSPEATLAESVSQPLGELPNLAEVKSPLFESLKETLNFGDSSKFGPGLKGAGGRGKYLLEGLGQSVANQPAVYGGGIFGANLLFGGDSWEEEETDWGDIDWGAEPSWAGQTYRGGPPADASLADIMNQEWDFRNV